MRNHNAIVKKWKVILVLIYGSYKIYYSVYWTLVCMYRGIIRRVYTDGVLSFQNIFEPQMCKKGKTY